MPWMWDCATGVRSLLISIEQCNKEALQQRTSDEPNAIVMEFKGIVKTKGVREKVPEYRSEWQEGFLCLKVMA